MSQDRRQMDRYLDRIERMLDRCIEADKAARKERRAGERRKKLEEEAKSGLDSNDEPKH